MALTPSTRRVPALRGGDTQRLTESLAESLVLRAAAKPVTFTFKMVRVRRPSASARGRLWARAEVRTRAARASTL